MPYSIGSDRLERTELSKIKSKLAEDDERRLTTDMRELYDRLKPTSAVEEKRGKLVNKLQDLLNNTWPGHDIQVHLFGSSGNLLCSDDSDGEPTEKRCGTSYEGANEVNEFSGHLHHDAVERTRGSLYAGRVVGQA